MPRNPQITARVRLEQSVKVVEGATKAVKAARDRLNVDMVKAVQAGMSRGDVAKIVGVSMSRVSQIPGMPPGPNSRNQAAGPTNPA